MKRSSIFTKVLLMVLILVLAFALFACNKKKPQEEEQPAVEESKTLDKIGNIVLFANPLLDSVKSIKQNSTISADAGLSVSYKTKESEDTYSLKIVGNLNSTDSDARISFSNAKNTNMVDLAYVADKFYLKQPLTALNSDGWKTTWDSSKVLKSDETMYDVSAFNASVDYATDVLMYNIAKAVDKDAIKNLNLGDIGNMLKTNPTISKLNVDSLITLEESDGYYKITTKPALFKTIKSLVGDTEVALGLTVGGIMDMIFGDSTPTLTIEARVANNVVTQLAVGFISGDNTTTGKITIDVNKLEVSNQKAVTVSAPSYTNKILTADAHAYVGHTKNATVDLQAYVNPNITSAADAYLAYAEAMINESQSYILKGVANSKLLNFNTAGLYSAINAGIDPDLAAPAKTDYTAKIHDNKGDTPVYKTLAQIAEEGAKDWHDNAVKDHGTNQDTTGKSKDNPKKGMFVNIYETLALGGDGTLTLANLEKNWEKDGFDAAKDTYEYLAPSEQLMMQALKGYKIGNFSIGQYVGDKITIDTAAKDSNGTYYNYLNTVKSILGVFAANDTWIIGFDLVNAADLSSKVKAWGDFFTLDNWVVRDTNDKGEKVLKEPATAGAYGIFDWNKDTYKGGAVIAGTDAANKQDDILDVCNLFTKWDCDGDATLDEFNSESISFAVNAVLARTGLYFADDVVYTAAQKTAIKALKPAGDGAKTYYQSYEDAKDAYDTAKKAYNDAKSAYEKNMTADTYAAMNTAKTAMDNAKKARDDADKAYTDAVKGYFNWDKDDPKNATYVGNIKTYADKVIKAVTGYSVTESNYLKAAIDGGMYFNLGCDKDAGLNGFIELRPTKESTGTAVFARVEIKKLGFVDKVTSYQTSTTYNDIATAAAAATFIAEPTDLTAYTGKGDNAEYTNVGKTDPRSGILGELLNIWDGYCKYVTPAA